MQKGFGVIYILVGVLILSFVAGGAYYLGKSNGPKPSTPVVSQTPQPISPSPSPDETANWKTYTNDKYKFTIQYPPSVTYEVKENEVGPDKVRYYAVILNINTGSVKIIVNDPYGGYNPTLATTGNAGQKSYDISIAGIKTTKVINASETNGSIRTITSPSGDKFDFQFSFPQNELERIKVRNLIDQILSTFKFTQ